MGILYTIFLCVLLLIITEFYRYSISFCQKFQFNEDQDTREEAAGSARGSI